MEWKLTRWWWRWLRRFSQWFDPHTPLFGARIGLLVTLLLAVGGIALGLWTGSLTVQSDGIVAATDVLTSLLFLAALRHSFRSPDVIHNYGYGKYESLGILLNSLLLAFALLYAGGEIFSSFEVYHPISQYLPLIAYSALSLVLLGALSKLQRWYAERYQMPLLAYDADLWKLDAYAEAGVLVSLIVGNWLTQNGYTEAARWLDFTIALALLLLNIALILPHVRGALNQLLDRTLPESIQLAVLAVIVEHLHEICEFRQLHTRQSGRDLFMELDVVMPFDMPMEQAYATEQRIQQAIRERYPTAIVRLYAVPCPRDCVQNGQRFCPVLLHKQQTAAHLGETGTELMEQQEKLQHQ